MKLTTDCLLLLPFIPISLALYYPPILPPKSGDIISAGSNFTIIWDTKIPPHIAPSHIANYTSEVRLGIYFGPPPPDEVYEEWTLYSPIDSAGEVGGLYFYENQGPHFGFKEYQMPEDVCSDTVQYVVVWYDAYPDEVFSGEFWVGGGC